MLQIIVMSVLIGFALTALGKKAEGITKLVEQGNDVMMYLVNLVMKLAPYGSFGLIATAVDLPVEGIGLILGIDRLLDMARTSINITGDAACAVKNKDL